MLTAMPNAQLETKRTSFGNFRGIERPLFPELVARNLRIFTGVEQDLLDSLSHGHPREELGAIEFEPRRQMQRQPQHLPENFSVGRSGSCMISMQSSEMRRLDDFCPWLEDQAFQFVEDKSRVLQPHPFFDQIVGTTSLQVRARFQQTPRSCSKKFRSPNGVNLEISGIP
jgi:hypothetical protein